MRSLRNDQRGLVFAYIMVLAVVLGVAIMWIIFNEVVLHLGDIVETYGSASGKDVWAVIVLCWRALPFILIIGAILWAILRATREEPYRTYGY